MTYRSLRRWPMLPLYTLWRCARGYVAHCGGCGTDYTYRDLGLRDAELAIIEHRRAHGWRRTVAAETQRRAEAYDRYRSTTRARLIALVLTPLAAAVIVAAVLH